MCWRDNEAVGRRCSFCGQVYFGDLGHKNCPAFKEEKEPEEKFVIPKEFLEDPDAKKAGGGNEDTTK